MSKKVFNFKDFVLNEYAASALTNEGFLSDTAKKTGEWLKNLAIKIKEGLIKLIPSGDKKGLPVGVYFSPADGTIKSQVDSFYKNSSFSKENDMDSYIRESESTVNLDEARVPLEYTEEDQTVRNISTIEMQSMIEKLYRSKKRGGRAKAIFIYGAPGIGKTQIVAQAADNLGVGMGNLDLQFMAPEDLLGIPKVVDVKKPEYDDDGKMTSLGKGMTRPNPTSLLPESNWNGKNDEGGILFLDEMNRANKMILNSIMQFVQLGRIADYQLPDKWVIVAAGNRPAEADVADFDFALADRFNIVNLVPKIEDWVKWARKTGDFEPEFIDFVERNEDLFHFLDVEKATLKFPTPRSWTDAAQMLKDEITDVGADTWKELPPNTVYNIYADSVGPAAAAKLKAYLDVIRKVSEKDLEEIITKPEEAKEIAKGAGFSSVIYGVYEMALRKAEELSSDDKATTEDIFNIMRYFNRYKELEALAWIYKRITEKYPDFAVTDEVIKTKEEPDSKLKIAAARMIQAGARDKKLI